MSAERIIWDAKFNERVTTYWLIGGAVALVVSCVGVVLLPVWIVLGTVVTRRYLQTYRCTLTSRNLKVNKGWLVRVEKTIPLDRITDIAVTQGPLMRLFELEAFSVETAGQSTPGSFVQLVGIQQGRKFRDAVLQQRDLVVGSEEDRQQAAVASPPLQPPPIAASADESRTLLAAIHHTLLRIEEQLKKR